jgi:hypothetical protein
MPEAARTLVKSPPELWAEVSDPESLTRHLGAFGEIRITRLEPEATVAWEGDRVRGTVDLRPAGWGTKVTVTAEEVEDEPEPDPDPEPEPEPEVLVIEEPPPARGGLRGLWARLFGGAPQTPPIAVANPQPPSERCQAPSVEAEDPSETNPRPPSERCQAPGPDADARCQAPGPDAEAVLDGMLGSLGSAHHRPFSR